MCIIGSPVILNQCSLFPDLAGDAALTASEAGPPHARSRAHTASAAAPGPGTPDKLGDYDTQLGRGDPDALCCQQGSTATGAGKHLGGAPNLQVRKDRIP